LVEPFGRDASLSVLRCGPAQHIHVRAFAAMRLTLPALDTAR
jgi:hypothetical protein